MNETSGRCIGEGRKKERKKEVEGRKKEALVNEWNKSTCRFQKKKKKRGGSPPSSLGPLH